MPDIKDHAPTLAEAQPDPAAVKEKLAPKAPPAKDPPKLTPRQIHDMLTWYSAGERHPEDLARMAVCDVALATALVAESDALKAAVQAKPDEELTNSYKPVEAVPAEPIEEELKP